MAGQEYAELPIFKQRCDLLEVGSLAAFPWAFHDRFKGVQDLISAATSDYCLSDDQTPPRIGRIWRDKVPKLRIQPSVRPESSPLQLPESRNPYRFAE